MKGQIIRTSLVHRLQASRMRSRNPDLASDLRKTQNPHVMPGAFSYDFSDDDSDVEVIPASLFHDNSRHIYTPNLGSLRGRCDARVLFSNSEFFSGDAYLQRLKRSNLG